MAGTILIVEGDPDTVRLVEPSGPCVRTPGEGSPFVFELPLASGDVQLTRVYATVELAERNSGKS